MSDPDEKLVLFRRAPASLRRIRIEKFARLLRDRVAGGREFRCLVTDDRELRRLNRDFRGQDYPTDVLAFPAESGPGAGAGEAALGDLAISAGRAAAQARELGHPVEQEIRVLMLHGLLHLMGLDHETDRGRMARVEAGWRRRLELPAGLTERVRA